MYIQYTFVLNLLKINKSSPKSFHPHTTNFTASVFLHFFVRATINIINEVRKAKTATEFSLNNTKICCSLSEYDIKNYKNICPKTDYFTMFNYV